VALGHDGRTSLDALEAKHPLPQAGVFGLGVGDEKLVAFHRDVTEDNLAGAFENANVAIGRAETGPLDFRKIAKPSKSRGADRLSFRINDEMRCLIVVSVDGLTYAQSGFLHEADRATAMACMNCSAVVTTWISISLSDRVLSRRTGFRLAFDLKLCNDAYSQGWQEAKV